MERKFCVFVCRGVQKWNGKFSWAAHGNEMMNFPAQHTARVVSVFISEKEKQGKNRVVQVLYIPWFHLHFTFLERNLRT